MARFLVLVKGISAQDVTADAWKIDDSKKMVFFYTNLPSDQAPSDDSRYISAAVNLEELAAIIRVLE